MTSNDGFMDEEVMMQSLDVDLLLAYSKDLFSVYRLMALASTLRCRFLSLSYDWCIVGICNRISFVPRPRASVYYDRVQ